MATQYSSASAVSEHQAQLLLSKMKLGEQAALKELHQLFSKRIYAFALNRLHDEQEAESVMVDVLYEVWKHPDRFRGESQFSTWILGIAKFKVLMVIRGRQPQTQELDETIIETTPDESLGAFDIVLNTQHRHHIMGCLETLPDVQKECLQMTFYDELSVAEIANLQNCPEGTVKTRLFHARKNIKDCLEDALQIRGGLQLVSNSRSENLQSNRHG